MKVGFKIISMICLMIFPFSIALGEPDTVLKVVEDIITKERQANDQLSENLSVVETFSIEDSPVKEGYTLNQILKDDRPAIDQIVKVYSGDTMITQRTGKIVECIVPNDTWQKNYSGATFLIKANHPICLTPGVGYIGDYLHYSHPVDSWTATVDLKEKKGKLTFVVLRRTLKKDAIEGVDFERTVAFKSLPDSLQQNIEYSGRSGSVLRFTYSEFKSGYARDAFTREFTMDLDEGNLGGFKGVIFEVLKASNFEITYRIKRQFQ